MTYAVDGKQYVSLLVGFGGTGSMLGDQAAQHGWKYGVHPRRLYTFALDGNVALPAMPPRSFAQPIDPADFVVDEALAKTGLSIYAQSCFMCHGGGAVAGGGAPDLRESPIALSRAAFHDVVVNGAKLERGMPRFAHFDDSHLEALTHYIRQMARQSKAVQHAAK